MVAIALASLLLVPFGARGNDRRADLEARVESGAPRGPGLSRPQSELGPEAPHATSGQCATKVNSRLLTAVGM